MKRLAYLSLLGLIFIQASCKKDDEINIQADSTLELEVFNLINEYRNSIALSDLEMNTAITEECRTHSYNMAFGIVDFGHDGVDSRFDRLTTELSAIGAAENVAYGQTTAQEVVDGWINSPGHKANIEGDYNLTGIGIVNDADGRHYFTQIFINKPAN